jgi:hypothetical protein
MPPLNVHEGIIQLFKNTGEGSIEAGSRAVELAAPTGVATGPTGRSIFLSPQDEPTSPLTILFFLLSIAFKSAKGL